MAVVVEHRSWRTSSVTQIANGVMTYRQQIIEGGGSDDLHILE